MSIDHLRELSGVFGAALRQAVDDLAKDAEVRGGGLRHGDVEWQVTYFYDGLRRLLTFGISESTGALVTVSAQAAATDEKGRWASALAGSTSLPQAFLEDQVEELVRQLVDQTRFIANSLGENDLRSLLVGGLSARLE
jgi:hypothetical protein